VQVVAIFGVSGVGKSWLISRFASANPVAHVQASRLLREAKAAIDGRNTTSEQLRTDAVLDNQMLLIQGERHGTTTLPFGVITDDDHRAFYFRRDERLLCERTTVRKVIRISMR
jgi:adenylate kinase